MANLEDICRHYQAAGLYTHVYASCGFFADEKPTMTFSALPDGAEVFDLSSLTKALVTTPLAIWRCEQLGLDPHHATLIDLFGEACVSAIDSKIGSLTVSSVLRHEAGFPPWRNFYVECEGRRQTLSEVIARVKLSSPATSAGKDNYSDVGLILLGRLLEISTKKRLVDLWWEQCDAARIKACRSLGPGAHFARQDTITTGYCPVRSRALQGEVHDENCWALGGFTGHAGLFGSGKSVESFLGSLWKEKFGRKVFAANFAESSSTGDSLMGWRKGQDESSNSFAEGRGCGHLGFTGTAFWVDPKTESYVIFLTNRVVSGRITPKIKSCRREVFGAMWDVLKDVKSVNI